MINIKEYIFCCLKALFSVIIVNILFADDNRISPNDIIYGNQNAPITVIEYSALTCPACALYDTQIFPKIYKKFIKTGKIRYIWRSVIPNQAAKYATKLLYCQSGKYFQHSQEDYIKNIKNTFTSMRSWIRYNEKGDLKKFSSLALINNITNYKSCFTNTKISEIIKELEDFSLQSGISGTPSFVIDGNAYTIGDFSSANTIAGVKRDTVAFFAGLIKKKKNHSKNSYA